MPEFVMKPERFTAEQFDGTHLLPGMTFDMGGAFIINAFNEQIYVPADHWIVDNGFGMQSVYSDEAFKKRFAPAE
jgi:hypothetical protein